MYIERRFCIDIEFRSINRFLGNLGLISILGLKSASILILMKSVTSVQHQRYTKLKYIFTHDANR